MKAHPDKALKEPAMIQTTGRPGKKNIMINPSFEDVTVPGVPDYWTLRGGTGLGKLIGGPESSYGLDAGNPFHGKAAFKIITGPDEPRTMRMTLQPQNPQPTPYVLSAYMKADRDGMAVSMQASGWRGEGKTTKSCSLTTDWKRYSMKVMIPGRFHHLYGVVIIVQRRKAGAVWIDAVQLERGEEATEFQP